MEVDIILVRRSPVKTILKVLSGTLFLSILYSVLVMVVDVVQFLPLLDSKIIEYDLVFFCFYVFIITLVTFWSLLKWSCESYEIRNGEIIHKSGIINKRQEQYSLSNIENIFCTQNIMGRIFKYGTISIFNPLQKTEINMNGIVDPELQMNLIKKAIMPKGGVEKIIPMVL